MNARPEQIPENIGCARDYEVFAPRHLPAPVFAYIAGGSAADLTLGANRRAFDAWHIAPRVLRDVSQGQARLLLPGRAQPHPIMLAPVAHQMLAHPSGELETVRAAAATQSGMVCSTLSSQPLEEIARTGGAGHWFQLYWQPRREVTADLLRRAELAGFSAIVLTVDAPVQVPSQQAQRAGFRMPANCVAANLRSYDVAAVAELPVGSRIFQGSLRTAPQWQDLTWLLEQSSLPVWVKGVLHAEDARALQAAGVAGVVVSNHGGRGLDGAVASLAALPAIRAAVGPDFPLLLDSGIRSGTDVFKALALGADGVLVGRLQIYALAVAGALGVAHLLKLLREELEVVMALSGCASLDEVRAVTLVSADNVAAMASRPTC